MRVSIASLLASLAASLALALSACAPSEEPPPVVPITPPPPPAPIARVAPRAVAVDCGPLERATTNATALRDVVGALLVTPEGENHRAIAEWIARSAPRRADALRILSADYTGEVRDLLVTAAGSIGALGREAKSGAPMESDHAALSEALHHAMGFCPAANFASPTRAAIAPEAVMVVVTASRPRIRACYDDARARIPALEGRVVVRFKIAPRGSVEDVQDAGGDLSDAALLACVADVFGTMRFASPGAQPLNIAYPLVFKP